MRVLQVHKDFEPLKGGGGTARHIQGLATALAAKGCEVEVASLQPEIIETPYRSFHAAASDLSPHIKRADVVHVHGARSKYAVWGAILAARYGKPFFYTPHAFYEPHGTVNALAKKVWDRTAEKFLLERGSRTILLTDAWFGWLKARGISDKHTAIIPNCVLEANLIAPPPADSVQHLPGAPAILTIGRLDPVKRVDDVIRALATPALAAGHFHIIGKGDQRPELEALASQLGVADRVTFHGFVDDEGVARMIAQSDVFVLASEQEGLPTVLLEMLLARKAVVCTRIPGNLAIMNVAQATTTCEVGDVEALARLLSEAKDQVIGDAAVARLREAFTWERRADEILALYEAGLANRGR